MTLEQALRLQKGDRIANAKEGYKIRRLTYGVWVNEERTDVRVSMASWRNGEWISPLDFVRVPAKARYDFRTKSWVREKKDRDGKVFQQHIPLDGADVADQLEMV